MSELHPDIINALNKKLMDFDGGSYRSKISLHGGKFDEPHNGIWIRQKTFFPLPKMLGSGVSGVYRVKAIYQLNVCCKSGDGIIAVATVASNLSKWFPRGMVLIENSTSVRVEKSYVLSPLDDSPVIQVPVKIEVWSYSQYQPSS